MIDTHCHLNFKAFRKNLADVIEAAKRAGVNQIIVPGTDVETSKKAVEIAERYEEIWAAVGIHPHHVYQIQNSKGNGFDFAHHCPEQGRTDKIQNHNSKFKNKELLNDLERLLVHQKVVAIGEVGLDKHVYQKTKYENYQVDNELIELQKELLRLQIKLAIKYKKTIILHNRESTKEILDLLITNRYPLSAMRVVFHCCEPDDRLLEFAIQNHIYLGVDGDVTYREDKQAFVKKIPPELLVLETDSPYLLPEPLRSKKAYPNEPKNIPLIAEFISQLRSISINQLIEITTKNAERLFLTSQA